MAHSSLLYLFWQEPQPLAGIGTEVITVEVEIGDGRQAGAAPTPGTGPDKVEVERVDPVNPEKAAEDEKAPEKPELKPDEKRREVAKEQEAEQPKEQKPEDRQRIAMVETPQAAEIPTVLPRETPPDMQAVIAPPREQPKEVQRVERTQEAVEQIDPRQAANGTGIVVSVSAMAAYNGRVSAHLIRHQRYPDALRSKPITGKGWVVFSIDGSGQVISASVKTSSGSTILDQEMTAMVLRASPFPAPPDGRPKDFNAPVTFQLPQ
jgi:periplasmic protein TonB